MLLRAREGLAVNTPGSKRQGVLGSSTRQRRAGWGRMGCAPCPGKVSNTAGESLRWQELQSWEKTHSSCLLCEILSSPPSLQVYKSQGVKQDRTGAVTSAKRDYFHE